MEGSRFAKYLLFAGIALYELISTDLVANTVAMAKFIASVFPF